MDIHTVDSEDFSVADVVKAHMEDLAVESQFGVKQRKYWVNEAAKTIFCLMEGPDKAACHAVHETSHGQTACNIIEVSDDEFNLFLGTGHQTQGDLAQTPDGKLDTGYRTIISILMAGSRQGVSLYPKIKEQIELNHGDVIHLPEETFKASFIYAYDAIAACMAIDELLNAAEQLEYNISLITGKPVDEVGDTFFEETKGRLGFLNTIGLGKGVCIDTETWNLSQKDQRHENISADNLRILKEKDIQFLSSLFGLLSSEHLDSDLNVEQLCSSLGISKTQLNRKTKALAGFSPNQLIQEVRLVNSLSLLKAQDQTVSEIAYTLGFNTPTYFTRVFKKRFGFAPSQYSR